MSYHDATLRPPHFPLPAAGAFELPGLGADNALSIGALLLRGAECLVAALHEPTSQAGLNEARYRVLAALKADPTGECSQTDLAALLLQSESNLSTLLERMSVDGLIARKRSESDRRRSLIRLTADGQRAFERAARLRAAAVAKLLRPLARDELSAVGKGLARIVGTLETSLKGPRRTPEDTPVVRRSSAPLEPLARQ
ncbi:MAG: MarR family winged helix-turn-helix transcriptional regulator [Planctomycetaceae bacterium]